jgi:hypothetical protein
MWEKRDQEVGQVFATAEQALHSPQKKRVEVPKEYAELMEKNSTGGPRTTGFCR